MDLNQTNTVTVDLVDSNDEDAGEDDVVIIGQGTKRKIIEIELENDIVLGVVDNCSSAPKKEKGKKIKVQAVSRKRNKKIQAGDVVVDEISPYHWTSDMRKYYNKVSIKEMKFSVDRIKKSMPKGQHLWKVHGAVPLNVKDRNSVCFHCGQFGHQERNCKNFKCYMCGNGGHHVKGCPQRKCMTCGNKTPKNYVTACGKCLDARGRRCFRCRMFGHGLIDCTDHWRRFHNVTVMQRVTAPVGPVYKEGRNLWCCNCGRRGHVHDNCQSLEHNIDFVATSTFVASYDRAFPGDRAECWDNVFCDYEISTTQNRIQPVNHFPNATVTQKPQSNRYFHANNENDHIRKKEKISKKLNNKQRREAKRAKKAKRPENVDKNQPRQDERPTKSKKKSKEKFSKKPRKPNSEGAIKRWNNFLMGIK